MPNPFIAILQALLAAAGESLRLPSDSDTATLIPKDTDFSWFFNNDHATFDNQFTQYFAEVKDRWDRADLLGLKDLLEQNIVASEAASDAEMATSSIKRIEGLVGAKFEMNTHRISLRNVGQAIDLIENDAQTAISLFSSEAIALEYLHELRELDDILIRMLSARSAADIAGVSLAEILALYRTEGNLGAVQPYKRLPGGLPALDDGLESSRLNSVKGSIPNIFRRVYLTDPSGFTDVDKKKAIQNDALFIWLIQIAGLDIVAHRVKSEPGDPLDELANWSKQHWDHKGPTVTVASRKAHWEDIAGDFEVEWIERDAADRLVVEPFPQSGDKPSTGSPTYVRVVPKDPERLIATALSEAALFMRMIGSADVFLFGVGINGLPVGHSPSKWIMPARLTYAIYNLYVSGPNSPRLHLDGGDFPYAFVISAISHAHRSKKAIHKPLRDEINNDDTIFYITEILYGRNGSETDVVIEVLFREIVKKLHCRLSGVGCKGLEKKKDDSASICAEFQLDIVEWLANSTRGKIRIELIAHFIETANLVDWGSWNRVIKNDDGSKTNQSARGNANRYHLHLDYYQRVTGEPLDF